MTFERGTLLASISLDAGGKIGGLVFHDETNDATRAALERFFTDRAPSAASFSDAFLAHIPLAQIAAITAQIKASEGKFVRLDLRDGAYYAVFEKAENHVQAALDAASKFTLLLLRPATARTSRV